LYRLRDIATYW